jgi:hypothetical protein
MNIEVMEIAAAIDCYGALVFYDDDEDWDYDSPAGDMRRRVYDSLPFSMPWDAVQPDRRAEYTGAAEPSYIPVRFSIAAIDAIIEEMWSQGGATP